MNLLLNLFCNNPNKPDKYFSILPTPLIDNYVLTGHMMASPTHRMFPSLFLPKNHLSSWEANWFRADALFFLERHTSQTREQEMGISPKDKELLCILTLLQGVLVNDSWEKIQLTLMLIYVIFLTEWNVKIVVLLLV